MNNLFIWVTVLLCAAGCSKIEDEGASRILGRWQWVGTHSYEFQGNGLPWDSTYTAANQDYVLEFKKNGRIRWYTDGELQGKIKFDGLSSEEYNPGSIQYLNGYDIRVFYSTNENNSSESTRWYNRICSTDCCMYENRFPYNSKCEDDINYRNCYVKLD